MNLNIVILAAGKGTRMKSDLPKVLQPLARKPLLAHVITTAISLNPNKIVIVYGHQGELVKQEISNRFPNVDLRWVEQTEQLGTGHAVAQALPELKDESQRTLILYGDVPLTKADTIINFLETTQQDTCGLLTVKLDDPTGYGRIIRDQQQRVQQIVEQKDATPEQLNINEVNTGIMLIPNRYLQNWLPRLSNNNAQGEYYLTDVIKMAADQGIDITACVVPNRIEVEGVNDKHQLAKLERMLQTEIAERLLTEGVTLADPNRLDIRGSLSAGKDCYIDVNCVFEGQVELGNNVFIGPNCHLIDCKIGDNTVIKSHSVIESGSIGNQCDIGPFARIRPGTRLSEGAKIGNFVETKNAQIGNGSKVNHLTYIGDSKIGNNVNVGAGTITCNYDGANKHQTIIGDNAFIGSNSSLVAPVEIGEGATIGAGSTITKQAKPEALTVTRAKQITIEGWQRPTKKS